VSSSPAAQTIALFPSSLVILRYVNEENYRGEEDIVLVVVVIIEWQSTLH
jgi:hypothetical protein